MLDKIQTYYDEGWVLIDGSNIELNTDSSEFWLENDEFFRDLIKVVGFVNPISFRLNGQNTRIVSDRLRTRIFPNLTNYLQTIGIRFGGFSSIDMEAVRAYTETLIKEKKENKNEKSSASGRNV